MLSVRHPNLQGLVQSPQIAPHPQPLPHAGGGEPDSFLVRNTPSPHVGEGAGGEGAY